MLESDIEAYLVKRVKALGGEVRKVQWVGRRDAPDRVVMLPSLFKRYCTATVWVELKKPGKRLRKSQENEHAKMRGKMQCTVVIDSIEGVDELLR